MNKTKENLRNFQISLDYIKKNKICEAEKLLLELKKDEEFKIDALVYLGVCKIKSNKKNTAINLLKQAIEISINHEFANLNLGLIYFDNKDFQNSIKYLKKTFEVNSKNLVAIYHLGLTNLILKNFFEAEKYFNKVLELNDSDQNALLNLGIIYNQKKDSKKTFDIYNKILKINPNNLNALNNIGILNYNLLNYDEAISYFTRCIKINKKFIPAYNNLGRVNADLRNFDQAKELFNKSILLNQNDFVSKFELSKIFFSLGDIENAFKLYENRKLIVNDQNLNFIKQNFKSIEWNGEKLTNKKIIILSEQGFGDVIQFSRYINFLKDENEIYFLVNSKLNYILRNLKVNLINNLEEIPNHDYYQSILTLPGIYYKSKKKILGEVNYIKTDDVVEKKWSNKLGHLKKYKVGIFWQGNKNYTDDIKRSIPLIKFEKIIKNKNLDIISFQKGFGSEQIKKNQFENYIKDFSFEIDMDNDAFKDTVSILKKINLLITVDSAIAHIAGTMGIKTWLLLFHNPHWVWQLQRNDFIFYKSVEIIEQDKPGDWNNVFKIVEAKLDLILSS